MADSLLPIFNAQWYLSQYPDIAAAVERGETTAQQHFELHGKNEGRSPGPLFNATQYLQDNPDVAAAMTRGEINPYDHFVQHGITEGRSPLPLFDADFYLAQNPDVATAVAGGETSAIQHLLTFGLGEGRQLTPFFNLNGYLSANPDVASAVNEGKTDPLTHLLQYGLGEGRLLSNGVDLSFFANDPAFNNAIAAGNYEDAFGRVSEVAPFLPTFAPPSGWVPAADTPIPQGFVPPAGQYLKVPDNVSVPPGTQLPDAFGPDQGDGGGNPPGPYFLTAADDIIVGTTGDDVFHASMAVPLGFTTFAPAPATLNNGDKLNGNGGRDVLNIGLHSYEDGTTPTISNIEVINNSNVGVPYLVGGSWVNYATLNLEKTSGLQELWTDFTDSKAGPSGIISGIYQNASLDTTFGVRGVDGSMNASIDVSVANVAGTDDTLKLALDGSGGAVGIGWNNNKNAGIENLSVDVAAGNATSIGFADYATATTLTVTGAGDVSITEINTDVGGATIENSNALATVDASAATGSVNLSALFSTSLRDIHTGSGNDVVVNNGQEAQTINVGAGDDKVYLGVVQSGHRITLGEGSDTIEFNAAGNALGNIRLLADESGDLANIFTGKMISVSDFDGADDVLEFSSGSLNGSQYLMDSTQSDAVTGVGDFYTAVARAATTIGANHWTTFQFGPNSYIFQNDDTAAFDLGDGLIQLTGFTGTLDGSNLIAPSTIPG